MEDDSAFAYKDKKAASSMVLDLLFSHVGLFFIVVLYATLGAMAFVSLESGHEQIQYLNKQVAAESINNTMNYMTQKMWYYQAQLNWTLAQYTTEMMKDLVALEKNIMREITNNKYDGTVDGWTKDWTFAKSLLLTMTIITTIGYGHISPKTYYGQMFCVVYALIGCPLLLLFLANVGDAMASSLVYIYSRWCCRWCRATRNLSELPEDAGKGKLKLLIDDDVGNEDYMPTANVTVPIIICLVLLTFYVLFGAVLFVSWEGWPFHSACYFTFITISTIGYGDYYPKSAMVGNLTADFVATSKMFFVALYLLMGMALLSMAINLMQDQLLDKASWLAKEIGLKKDTKEDEDDIDPKKSDKNGKKKEKSKKSDSVNDDDDEAMRAAAMAKRRESVDVSSQPENMSDGHCATPPSAGFSPLPGMPE